MKIIVINNSFWSSIKIPLDSHSVIATLSSTTHRVEIIQQLILNNIFEIINDGSKRYFHSDIFQDFCFVLRKFVFMISLKSWATKVSKTTVFCSQKSIPNFFFTLSAIKFLQVSFKPTEESKELNDRQLNFATASRTRSDVHWHSNWKGTLRNSRRDKLDFGRGNYYVVMEKCSAWCKEKHCRQHPHRRSHEDREKRCWCKILLCCLLHQRFLMSQCKLGCFCFEFCRLWIQCTMFQMKLLTATAFASASVMFQDRFFNVEVQCFKTFHDAFP